MKPVFQTIFTHPEGNCHAACIASILEVPLAALPDDPGMDWERRSMLWHDWCLARNLIMYTWQHAEAAPQHPGYAIAGGPSPRGDWLHSVVCFNGEMVHDPHPSGEGLRGIQEWTVFAALDPAKALTPPQE